ARALDELLPEIRPDPALRAGAEGAELQHLEDVSPAADSLAAIEDGPAAREDHPDRDRERERQREQEKEPREDDVEAAEYEILVAARALLRKALVARDQCVLELRRRGGHAQDARPAARSTGDAPTDPVCVCRRSSRNSPRSSRGGRGR